MYASMPVIALKPHYLHYLLHRVWFSLGWLSWKPAKCFIEGFTITEGVVLGIVEGASELKTGNLVSRSDSTTSKNVGFSVFSIRKHSCWSYRLFVKS